MSKEIAELSRIGKKINEAYTAVTETITLEEIEEFEEYLQMQETAMPLLDPTQYMRGGSVMIDLARMRVRALKAFWRRVKMDKAEVISVIRTTLLRRGMGTENSPVRIVEQFWSLDGKLLAENDGWDEKNKKWAKE